MEGDYRNQEAAQLLEDGWFFGNSLKSKPKIVRSNSDPSASLKKAEIFVHKRNASQTATSLLTAPSLPPRFGKKEGNLDEEDDIYGPRMSDLIMQAMPCKSSKAPSTLPCRIRKEVSGPKMSKLNRVSSLDSSLLMPSKHKSKRRSELLLPNRNLKGGRDSKSNNLHRSMSLKTLSDVEVQGFQDLGFTFKKEDLCPSVVDKLERLQLKEENEQGEVGRKGKMIPSLSYSWNATQTSQWAYSPPIPKWVDIKTSDEDIKQQIKLWARSVASNVN